MPWRSWCHIPILVALLTWAAPARTDCEVGDTPGVTDKDLDGYTCEVDCNDDPPYGFAQNPGLDEVCDSVDNDCSGEADDGLTLQVCRGLQISGIPIL